MAESEQAYAIEVHTRFLHPFRWKVATPGNDDASAPENLVARLRGVRFRDQIIWEPVTGDAASHYKRYREVYRAELHEHVANFLFPEKAGGGCACVRLRDNVVNTIFGARLHVRDSKGALQPWQLDPTAEVEVFLTPYRLGLLSISLGCRSPQPLPFEQVQEFNYRLAQQREAVCCRLGKPHPSEDASRWETISEDSRTRIRPAPALSAGVHERLGSAGGWFNLPEFKDWLLEPLGDLKLAEPRRQFQVFSVVRCPQWAVLDSPDRRDFWAAKVADFAQIHEAGHAGTPLGAPSTPCALLNRCHWAAVSSLGAAPPCRGPGRALRPATRANGAR